MPSSARCRRQRTRPPTTAHTKIRRHTACLESHQISATSAPLNTQADRRRQAYGELVMAARLALRNFRQLTFAYAVGTPDVSAVKDALSQTDSLTANVYQAAALTEIIASADGRRRARSIHDKTRDCADLFRSQELLSAIWPDLAVDKNLSSLSPEEIRKETPFDREEAKGHCDQLAAAIDQFIEAVNQELGQ